MKKQVVLTRKELNDYIDEQTNIIIEKMLKNKNKISENRERFKTEKRLTNKIFESMMRKMGLKKSVKLNESIGDGLFVEVRFVQGGDDDYNEIEQMFCGEQDGYCEANSQPVIDYLKQWDDGENEPTPNQPRIARGDTQYADENGDYILLYNSSVGGCFLLYRPATEQEIAWYNDNGPGSMSESKRRNASKYVNETNAKYSISPKGGEFKRRLKRGYGFKKKLQERKMINEGESYGWIVEPGEAQEAYNFALDYFGKEELNEAIVRCLGDSALSDCLAFIFRMYDFEEWYNRDDS